MSRAAKLAKRIERTVTGPMWHGPALDDVLRDVTHAHAAARPIPKAHTIWELVLHVTAWAEIARARLQGERIADPTAAEDWPPAPGSDSGTDPDSEPNLELAWQHTLNRLSESHRELADDARELEDEALDALIPGLEYRVSVLLQGVIEHGVYHGGQIAILRKTL
jgi:uncharacterized damage-inducible protein DinB